MEEGDAGFTSSQKERINSLSAAMQITCKCRPRTDIKKKKSRAEGAVANLGIEKGGS